jgi:ABC-2 type transport system ATP-binding protein
MQLLVEGITKSFKGKTVVDNVSFSMSEPGVFGLIGTNGAGKTTTIRVMLGIMPADSGQALWQENPITREGVRVGYMPEDRGIYMKHKVEEQLVYFARLHGMSKADAKKATIWWLERLGIPEYKNVEAEKLSKGNQQKIQLIATLLHDPELIILDEPFSGLDPLNVELFKSVIVDLTHAGKYIILSSHQMETVEKYCRDIVLLHWGKTVLSGNLREIKASYGHTNLYVEAGEGAEALGEQMGLKIIGKRAQGVEFFITGDEMANAYLQALLEAGMFPVRYEIREPSLHEIFVEKAGAEA